MSRGLGKIQRQIMAILEKDWKQHQEVVSFMRRPVLYRGIDVKYLTAMVYHPEWFNETGGLIDYLTVDFRAVDIWAKYDLPKHEKSSVYRAAKSLEKRGLVETEIEKGEMEKDPSGGGYRWSLPWQARRELRVKLVR